MLSLLFHILKRSGSEPTTAHVATEPTPTLEPKENSTIITPPERELFEELGDLGDPDGLNALYEQMRMDGRTAASLVVDFYGRLIHGGVDLDTAGKVTEMRYSQIQEEAEMVAAADVDPYED